MRFDDDSSAFSGSESGYVEGTRLDGDEEEEDLAKQLTGRETRAVRTLRVIVIAVLALATLGVSIAVYISTNLAEEDEFKELVGDYTRKVEGAFQLNAAHKMEGVENLALQLTSYVMLQTNATWPFITFPDFVVRGGSARSLSLSLYVVLSPFIVDATRDAWEEYSVTNQGWVAENMQVQNDIKQRNERNAALIEASEQMPAGMARALQETTFQEEATPYIFRQENGSAVREDNPEPFYPVWQMSPVLPVTTESINFNMRSEALFQGAINALRDTNQAVISEALDPNVNVLPHFLLDLLAANVMKEAIENEDLTEVENLDGLEQLQAHEEHSSGLTDPFVDYRGDPVSSVFFPVFDSFADTRQAVAILTMDVYWRSYLTDLLPAQAAGIMCVLENTLGQYFTYRIDGREAVFVGDGDLHDTSYDYLEETTVLALGPAFEDRYAGVFDDYCQYTLRLYPSDATADGILTKRPIIYTVAVVFFFIFTILVFVVYDRFVEQRQTIVLERAVRSTEIVSEFFPANVRDRLFGGGDEDAPALLQKGKSKKGGPLSEKHRLKNFLADFPEGGGDMEATTESKPLADLFPNTTVLFADIAGFTAWSSEREPSQVFTLLETLYGAFDAIARKRGVFKVETIGDCYVAVTGLPEPQENHAVIMTRFASDCMHKMNDLTRKLEISLGPDTGELAIRIGLHSGPVTAGVLRGEKSRFQLFGDTVNTAARMESNGQRNRIHVSQETADALNKAGKSHWVTAREGKIFAKGKGELQTYWVEPKAAGTSSVTEESSLGTIEDSESGDLNDWGNMSLNLVGERVTEKVFSEKVQRLIEWNAELLYKSLQKIVARREAMMRGKSFRLSTPKEDEIGGDGKQVREEVAEVLQLPQFDAYAAAEQEDPENIDLGQNVRNQIKEYVANIAAMYPDNPFHNFEHASHVTMSVHKMLVRIEAADHMEQPKKSADGKQNASELHQYTFGITSDPMTHFAVLLSALIHDVEHAGVANFVLVKEKQAVAERYKGLSVLEQNSIDVAWELLMKPNFQDFRDCIYVTNIELQRFRQLIVNVVIATDIFDKELSALRKSRWNKAFHEKKKKREEMSTHDVNLKATIVIEHIIQASDVAHTMQHWHIYQKWNKRLFKEMYKAFKEGRMDKDPSAGWYAGEIWFFDNYVIPLGKKLKECGVFGVASDQCLNYAVQNRKEWEAKGQDIVAEMLAENSEVELPEQSQARRNSLNAKKA